MNKILVIVSIILLVATVGLGVFAALNVNQVSQLEKTIARGQDQIKTLGEEKTGLIAENSRLKQEVTTTNGQITTLKTEKTSLQTEKTSLQDANTALNEKVKTLTADLDKKSNDLITAMLEKDNAVKKFWCTNPITSIDFKNNQTVNDALVKYVESGKNTEEPVSSKFWNVIWTSSNYSIHTISVSSKKDNINYIWKFTAYFKGEAYGDHVNAIFYNDRQCWLYLEK